MYATKLVNKNVVDNNAYISIGDPYKDAAQNVFRQPKKGEPLPKPMMMTVSICDAINYLFYFLMCNCSTMFTFLCITASP